MYRSLWVVLCALALLPASVAAAWAAPLPMIDAHSQVDHTVPLERIISLMDEGGVAHTILATRGKVKPEQLTAFAAAHPGRITPSVRTKGDPWAANTPKFYKLLKKQMRMDGYGAMAELILWHAEKLDAKGRSKAPQVVVPPDAPQVTAAIQAAQGRGWPSVIHIEFVSAGADRAPYMEQMEALLKANPRQPFLLIHMGQLEADDAARLLAAHGNLHFLTSHANPVTAERSREPWSNLFAGRRLAPAWRALVVNYPQRFVLAFDNVFGPHWGSPYLKQIELWREALADLPPEVGHAVAHRNAERLWRLPAVQ